MEIKEINQLVKNLSWEIHEEIQQESLKKLLQIDELQIPFLIQSDGKTSWLNAVKIIKQIGFPKNRLAIPKLIWLFQDMNWPGVDVALETLKGIDIQYIIPHIEEALIKANNEEDYMWVGGIKRIVDELNISKKDFKNKETYELLKLSDW